MDVMARDGSRILTGLESAAQRLDDALQISLGSYPWLRDYGSDLPALVDEEIDEEWAARATAAVAGAVSGARNGLGDVELVEVTLRALDDAGDAWELGVRATWIDPSGEPAALSARSRIAPPAPARVLTWRGAFLTWRGRYLTWRPS